jgi:cellulose synthase/poly-beta-1,6-N-acetylglucosamine synthase-like glycosyltransferase
MVILLLKAYIFFVIAVMLIYCIRSFIFTLNRAYGEQSLDYHDILDFELPSVTIMIPMHNEEKVVRDSMEAMLRLDYPEDKLEIIPINDHSQDNTGNVLREYAERFPELIKPFERQEGARGKPAALNDTMQMARGEVMIVFDADYIPPRNIVRDLAVCFIDPEVGAVMGRVIPLNIKRSTLARFLDLERTGGYQVDQQARFNMGLISQYGGTVGGFRKQIICDLGSFDPTNLTEDTELTFKLYINGWKVMYANRMECYEEAPETWTVRAKQVNRWSRGHTRCMIKYIIPLLKSHYLTPKEKLDGVLLLGIYLIPLILLLGLVDSLFLFYLGGMNIIHSSLVMLILAVYNLFGNTGPFFQIAIGVVLDGGRERVRLLPLIMVSFVVYLFSTSRGGYDAILDSIFNRVPTWVKTARFRKAV